MGYLRNVLVALDKLVNAALNGQPDETLSSRAWRTEAKAQPYWSWTRRVIDALFYFQPNHCAQSYANEKLRALMTPEQRERP